MGRKKNKEEEAIAATASYSDIFKNLFGDVDQDAAVPSIFSDSNPFKRKLTETISESNENLTHGDNVAKLKTKKRSKEKVSNFDSDAAEEAAEIPSGSKETKKSKNLKSFQILADENGGRKTNFGSRNENNKRNKRKRDYIESEYEAKKYGSVLEDTENVVHVGEKRKKAENAADMLVSKDPEEFDDESKLLRTVFVGNLPLKVKKKALIKEFSQFGEVESVRIRSVPIADTKIPRKGAIMLKKFNDCADSVHAYIVFKTEESALASLSHNMAVIGGNHIRVDRACPPRKKLKGEGASLYDNKRTIFVGNLPFDVKDEEVYQLFTSIKDLESSIEAVRVVRDSHIGLGKGIAYVLFKTREAANLVLRKRNLKIRNRELRISHARQDSSYTPSKRRNSFSGDKADSPNKKAAVGSRILNRNGGFNTKASTSYQGLRASKSGVQKKIHTKQTMAVKSKSKTKSAEKHNTKRPAVAARKAKANALKEGGATKQAGQKRKFSNRTPESFKPKKKAKSFR